jgi:hypothetical protein
VAKRSPGRKAARPTRASSGAVRELQRTVEQHTEDLNLQFRRIAQIQADLDVVKKTLSKLVGHD